MSNKKKAQKTAKKSSKTTKKIVKKTAKKAVKKTTKKTPISRKTEKRDRSDSVVAAVQAAQGAFLEVSPPDHVKLKKGEKLFFDEIIDEFATCEWTPHTTSMAAFLARYLYGLDYEQRAINKEGTLLERKGIVAGLVDKNTGKEIRKPKVVVLSVYQNPRKNTIDSYTKNIIALRRSLSLHARATEGETRDIVKRRNKAKETENSMKNIDPTAGLIAFPKSMQ